MFKIKGILKEKFHPDGFPLRLQNPFEVHLNTEEGVVRFINEQKPFKDINIKIENTNEDMTQYFLDKANDDKSYK